MNTDPTQRAQLEETAREWLDSDNGIDSYNGSTVGSLVTLLAAQRAAVLEEAAKIADRMAIHHDFWDGGREVGIKIAKECRQQAQEARA